jgi:hypothetical protein
VDINKFLKDLVEEFSPKLENARKVFIDKSTKNDEDNQKLDQRELIKKLEEY